MPLLWESPENSEKGAVMRNRWEDKADAAVEEPVTITESQLRSLKRGAALGLISFVLALVAVGVAGWTWFQGTKKTSGGNLATATESRPAAAAPAAVAPTNSEPSSSSAEPAPVTAAPSATGSAPTS